MDANTRLGCSVVRVGSPEKKSLPTNEYDVIGAFDVIEHLRDPRQSLSDLHAALKSGGLLAVVTPLLDSWSRHLLGRHWMEYKNGASYLFQSKVFDTTVSGHRL